jgi:endonuclease VIII
MAPTLPAMPEGDTIHRTAARLRAALADQPLTRVEFPRLAPPLPRPGERVRAVEARGKHLLIHLDGGMVVHTHQRMTGSWHLYASGERWRKSVRAARVVLGVHGTVAVCFASPVVEVLDERGIARHPALRRLGPDLCDPRADIDLATHRLFSLSAPDRPIGEALLDQRIACGVGNVYRCDVLFLTGRHPWTPVGDLSGQEGRALIELAAGLLTSNLDASRRTTVTDGPPGSLWVHGRGGLPCRRCATPVVVDSLGEQARYVYWCPTCQPRGR